MRIQPALIGALLLAPGFAQAACSVNPTPVVFGIYSPFNVAPTDEAVLLHEIRDELRGRDHATKSGRFASRIEKLVDHEQG